MLAGVGSRFLRGPWPFVGVAVIALVTRLASLDLIDYRYDDAVAVGLAFDIAAGQWTFFAPHSGSVATHPAFAEYVMALPALVARNVLWVAGFRAALDVGAIALLAWGVSRAAGQAAGWLTAVLYAVGPWSVFFARKAVVAPISLTVVLAVFGGLALVARGRAWGWPAAVTGVALSIGAHLTSIFLLPAMLICAWLGRRRVGLKGFALGLLPLAIMGGAYFAADSASGFANVQALLRASGGGGFSTAALDFALWQTSAAKLMEIAGLAARFAPEYSSLDLINLIPLGLLVAGLARAGWGLIRDRANPIGRAAGVLAVFWLSVVGLQLRALPAPQPHYLQLAAPAAFGLMGIGGACLWSWATRLGSREARLAAQSLMAAVLALVVAFDLTYIADFNAAAAGSGPFPGYRPIAGALRLTGEALRLDSGCEGGEILIGAPGADRWVDEGAAIYTTLLVDRAPRVFDSRESAIVPASCATWLIAPGAAPALAFFGLKSGPAALRAPVAPQVTQPALGTWEHGPALISAGYGLGETGQVTAALRITSPPVPALGAHWFARVVVGGKVIASKDIPGPQPATWRAGDTIVLSFDMGRLDLAPASEIDLRIGSYRYPDLTGIGVRLSDRN